jgi:hypothetical protein
MEKQQEYTEKECLEIKTEVRRVMKEVITSENAR